MSPSPEGLDWQSLLVELNDRRAIYAERFPVRLATAFAECPDPDRVSAAFDQQAATDVLRVFAGAWPTLGPHGAPERWHYVGIPNDPTALGIFAFRGEGASTQNDRDRCGTPGAEMTRAGVERHLVFLESLSEAPDHNA